MTFWVRAFSFRARGRDCGARIWLQFCHICKRVAWGFLNAINQLFASVLKRKYKLSVVCCSLACVFSSGTSELSICCTQYLHWISVVWSSTILAQLCMEVGLQSYITLLGHLWFEISRCFFSETGSFRESLKLQALLACANWNFFRMFMVHVLLTKTVFFNISNITTHLWD